MLLGFNEKNDMEEFEYGDIHAIFELADVFYDSATVYEQSVPLTAQPWDNISGKDKVGSAKEIYLTARDLALNGKKELNRKLKKIAPGGAGGKVLIDIKQEKSFLDKVVKRGRKADSITDLLRSALIVKDKNQVEIVVKKVLKDFKVGRYEIKQRGSDPEFGYYGSHHFLVKIGVIWAEVQVMTRKMWSYKREAHKVYDKYRSKDQIGKSDEDAEKERMDKAMSKMLFAKANVKNKIMSKRGRKSRR